MKDNIVINIKNAYDVIPFMRKNGDINLLVNTMRAFEKPELFVTDLSGNIIKDLMPFDHNYHCVGVDEKNIYVFTYNTFDSLFYVFNNETFNKKSEKILHGSRVQSVFCDGKKLYTLDVARNAAQVRYKNGNIKSDYIFKGNYVDIYFDGEKIRYTDLKEFGIDDNYFRQCKRKYGSELMELNNGIFDEKLSYDINNKIMYTAKRNIVYCSSKEDGVMGIMYFPDEYINTIKFDQLTNSLIVSSFLVKDEEKYNITAQYDGKVEIIPSSMIPDRIKSSESLLLNRVINKKLVLDCFEESKGDLNKMIVLLQELKEEIEKTDTEDNKYQLKMTKSKR